MLTVAIGASALILVVLAVIAVSGRGQGAGAAGPPKPPQEFGVAGGATGQAWEDAATVGDGPWSRTYRATAEGTALVTFLCALCGATVLLPFYAYFVLIENAVPPALVVATVAIALLVALVVARFATSATVIDQDHVTVRTLSRSRATAWRDIQAIDTEQVPVVVPVWKVPDVRERPGEVVVIYDREGARIPLPQIRNGDGLSVPREVAAMHGMWARQRGEHRPPPPEVEAAVERARARGRTQAAGSIVKALQDAQLIMMGTFLVLAGIFLALTLTGVLDGAFDGVSEFGGEPPSLGLLVVAAVVLVLLLRRGRRR